MRRIILGTDGSAGSAAAAKWCATVAAATGAEVIVAHAVPAVSEWDAAGGRTLGAAEATARELLEGEWTAQLRSAGLPIRTLLVHDNPGAFLVRIAEREDVDMVVLGRHDHPPWTPAHLGGVAHTVLHDARCPIAIVPRPIDQHTEITVPPIALVGVDGSAASLAALRFGLERTPALGLELRALYVVDLYAREPDPLDAGYDEEGGPLAAADAALAKVVAGGSENYPATISYQVMLGTPGDKLTRGSSDADLLIVGNVQRGRLGELLHGSTSHYCAAHASCPVVLVPAPKTQGDNPC